jgi:hypothetical protein
MDRSVPITVDLIAGITGLPTDGENPEQYLEEKPEPRPSQMRSRLSMVQSEVTGASGSVTSMILRQGFPPDSSDAN